MTIRKRRKKKRKIKYFRIFAVFLLFTGLIYAFLNLPIFNIRSIRVSGNEKVDTDLIISTSGLSKNDSYFFIDKDSIKKNIQDISLLEEVKIKRKLPFEVEIIVVERKAASTVQLSDKYLLVDRFGIVIDESESLMLNLTVLNGIGNEDNILVGENIFTYAGEEENKLLELVFNGENIYKFKSITLEEDQAELVLKKDIVVAFGSYNDVEYKLNVIDQMVKKIEEDSTKNASMILMEEGPDPILVYE